MPTGDALPTTEAIATGETSVGASTELKQVLPPVAPELVVAEKAELAARTGAARTGVEELADAALPQAADTAVAGGPDYSRGIDSRTADPALMEAFREEIRQANARGEDPLYADTLARAQERVRAASKKSKTGEPDTPLDPTTVNQFDTARDLAAARWAAAETAAGRVHAPPDASVVADVPRVIRRNHVEADPAADPAATAEADPAADPAATAEAATPGPTRQEEIDAINARRANKTATKEDLLRLTELKHEEKTEAARRDRIDQINKEIDDGNGTPELVDELMRLENPGAETTDVEEAAATVEQLTAHAQELGEHMMALINDENADPDAIAEATNAFTDAKAEIDGLRQTEQQRADNKEFIAGVLGGEKSTAMQRMERQMKVSLDRLGGMIKDIVRMEIELAGVAKQLEQIKGKYDTASKEEQQAAAEVGSVNDKDHSKKAMVHAQKLSAVASLAARYKAMDSFGQTIDAQRYNILTNFYSAVGSRNRLHLAARRIVGSVKSTFADRKATLGLPMGGLA